jgi:ANTAR domain
MPHLDQQDTLPGAEAPRHDGHHNIDGHRGADGHASTDGHGRAGSFGADKPVTDVMALLVENEGLRRRLASQPVIEQAKGILMGYYGIDSDTAFQFLCRWSQDTNTKLRYIAELLTESAASGAGSRPAPQEIVRQSVP